MRTIRPVGRFERDYKRCCSGKSAEHVAKLEAAFTVAIRFLQADEQLPPRYHDHALSGDWADHRECHIWPDLLLIYAKPADELVLVRLGSHSELFQR